MDSFSLIMIIIVVFIEKHIKQKKDVQCQIGKKGLGIFFFPYTQKKHSCMSNRFDKTIQT